MQLNLNHESSKHGIVDSSKCCEIVEHIKNTCSNVSLKGIMSIGPVNVPPQVDFANMKLLYDELKNKYEFKNFELSIGMSSDFEEAIKHGATMVRVGTSIFGKRQSRA